MVITFHSPCERGRCAWRTHTHTHTHTHTRVAMILIMDRDILNNRVCFLKSFVIVKPDDAVTMATHQGRERRIGASPGVASSPSPQPSRSLRRPRRTLSSLSRRRDRGANNQYIRWHIVFFFVFFFLFFFVIFFFSPFLLDFD